MSHSNWKRLWLGLLGTGLGLGLAAPAMADWALNMPRGATAISNEVYDLHMLILGICCLIAIVVFGVMIVSIFLHRKSRGVEPAQFHHSTKAEIIWTVIPILILVGMAVPAAETLVRMEDTRNADITVKVTGYQWKWRYDYLDDEIGFYSTLDRASNAARRLNSGIQPSGVDNYLLDVDNPLVVPVGAKVRLLITAADVLHAWWMPDFAIKKDAIPGFVNEAWFRVEKAGTYRGQCAELCGRDHGFMPVVVIAKDAADYAEWMADQRSAAGLGDEPAEALAATPVAATPVAATSVAAAATAEDGERKIDDLVAMGEALYQQHCAACHQADGSGMAPAFPALAGSPVVTGSLDQHVGVVLKGRPGTAMAPFGPQLTDLQLAAIVTYQRNAWGNDTGDVVQPGYIAAAR
jgi:cytochrome c oxidase subunit 2